MLCFRLSLPLILIATLGVTGWALPHQRPADSPVQSAIEDHSAWVNVNELLLFVSNNGSLAYDNIAFFGRNDGLYYPYVSLEAIIDGSADNTVLYSAGLWIGGVDSATGDTLVTVSEYSSEYYPGKMVNQSYDPDAETDPMVRVYRLFSDSAGSNPNYDYSHWPTAQGAPLNHLSEPALIGDQFLWSVYNDAHPLRHTNDAGSTAPLGLEIQQSVFAFNDMEALGKTVFIRARVINRGTRTLNGLRIGFWVDPDVGDSQDDLAGCDTALSLGYAYNATNSDAVYGSAPPAVGVGLLQGPLSYTGISSDTGHCFGQRWPGFVNLPMTAFSRYFNGIDPSSATESYHYLAGRSQDGTPLPSGSTFMVPGDPVAQTGEIDYDPSDRRFMVATGPITLRPADSTELVWAVIVGQGADRLSSLTILKYYTTVVREIFGYLSQSSCCIGVTGNVNGDAEEIVDISDLMAMVDFLFLEGELSMCPEENNVDRQPAIDIGDLMALVDFLFLEYDLPACP